MRTVIEISINYSTEEAYARLQNFFGANGYVSVQNGNETLMRGGDYMMRGFWFIAPQVLQDRVILQGFIGRPGKSEMALEGFVGAVVKGYARTAMDDLQQVLSIPYPVNQQHPVSQAVNPQYSANQAVNPQYPTNQAVNPQYPANQLNPQFQNQHTYVPAPGTLTEKNANFAVWSLVIGIVACILPFFGFLAGGIVIFGGLSLGFASLRTSKRELAIAGIVLNFIAIAFIILSVVLSFS